MAMFLVSHDMTVEEFGTLAPDHNLTLPNSVVDMFMGSLGEPEGGWPHEAAAVDSARREAEAAGVPARICRRSISRRPARPSPRRRSGSSHADEI